MISKKLIRLLPFILFSVGCASTTQLRELNLLKCESLATDIIRLRIATTEARLVALGLVLNRDGSSNEMIRYILDKAESQEALDFIDIKYGEKLDTLSVLLMSKAGCDIKGWVDSRKMEQDSPAKTTNPEPLNLNDLQSNETKYQF